LFIYPQIGIKFRDEFWEPEFQVNDRHSTQIVKIERIQNERWYKQVKNIHNKLSFVNFFFWIVCCTS